MEGPLDGHSPCAAHHRVRLVAVSNVSIPLSLVVKECCVPSAESVLGALNSDILTASEPVSEDMTALSPSPEADKPRLFYMFADSHSVRHLSVVPTSVFRPPLL